MMGHYDTDLSPRCPRDHVHHGDVLTVVISPSLLPLSKYCQVFRVNNFQ